MTPVPATRAEWAEAFAARDRLRVRQQIEEQAVGWLAALIWIGSMV